MLGTIEELNQDIDKFQKNIAASNELYDLLNKILLEIKDQNDSFDKQSGALVQQLDSLPATMEKEDERSNLEIREGVQKQVDAAVKRLTDEQEQYLQAVSRLQKTIEQYTERADSVMQVMEKVPVIIKSDQAELDSSQQKAISQLLSENEQKLKRDQEQYINELDKTRESVNEFQKELEEKYKDFIQTMENTNIAHLHEQNLQLQKSLNSRTTLLIIVSLVAAVFSLLGLFI